MVQTVNSELATRFIALVNAADECHEEYETKHCDACEAHLHMVSEGDQNELIAKIKAHAIATGSTDSEAALIASKFDRFAVEAKSCHRFTSFDAASIGGLLVGGPWMIEEIENQHEVSRYATELDCNESEVRQLVMSPLADTELCIRFHGDTFATFETYRATDCGWYALLPDSWFADMLEEIRLEAADSDADVRAWWDSQASEFMQPVAEYFQAGEIEFDADGNEENEPCEAGWYARLSAPGYMDCTEWQGPYATESEAARGLFETFAD